MEDDENTEGLDQAARASELLSEFEDSNICCVECGRAFVWTSGEQEFFRDKGLKHPPKRCRNCKKAKTERIAAIANAEEHGRLKIEVTVTCDECGTETTVPFYPTQGRPVLCRSCFLSNKTLRNKRIEILRIT